MIKTIAVECLNLHTHHDVGSVLQTALGDHHF